MRDITVDRPVDQSHFECNKCSPESHSKRKALHFSLMQPIELTDCASPSFKHKSTVETTIGLFLFEDEPSIGLAEVGDRNTIRECPTLLGIHSLHSEIAARSGSCRRADWNVNACRKAPTYLLTVAYCSAANTKGDASLPSTIDLSSGFMRSSRCQPTFWSRTSKAFLP